MIDSNSETIFSIVFKRALHSYGNPLTTLVYDLTKDHVIEEQYREHVTFLPSNRGQL